MTEQLAVICIRVVRPELDLPVEDIELQLVSSEQRVWVAG
jgi:hypothetical protein